MFTDEQKRQFRDEPGVLLEMRRATETTLNRVLPLFQKGSSIQAKAAAIAKTNMQDKLNPELAEKLIPDFPLGCRRLTVSLASQTPETVIITQIRRILGNM